MKILGIDNGLGGGLVLIEGSRVLGRRVMPTVPLAKSKRAYDALTIAAVLRGWTPDHIVLEYAQAMPPKLHGREQGTQSSFSIGYGAGLIAGIVAAIQLPHTVVRPATWMAEMFRGLPRVPGETKRLSAIMCGRLWPDVDWRSSSRSEGPHSGLIDAAMLAEYGRRILRAEAGSSNDQKEMAP